MSEFKPGCVITAAPNRIDNLNLVLKSLSEGIIQPRETIIVCDGWFNPDKIKIQHWNTLIVKIPKHEPGQEQPRNVGVRWLHDSTNYVWFLDSDCIVDKDTLLRYKEAHDIYPGFPRIMLGPYEWMGPGKTTPQRNIHNDPRWPMFRKSDPRQVYYGKLDIAAANFGGNLVWPKKKFQEVGGFWNELYHGRCEDGELGFRAASLNIPMSLVKEARAYHVHHEASQAVKEQRNKREVPLIEARHPWLKEEGFVVVNEDGKRFDQICGGCNESINSVLYWEHAENCQANL